MNKSEINKFRLCTLYCVYLISVITFITAIGCGASRHLTNQDIMWVDDDRYHVSEEPKERDPDYTWDYLHRSFIHPVDRFFKFPPVENRTCG